jgi:hypothetical protein
VDQLPPDQAAELRQLLEASDFFNLPETVGQAAPGAADYREYTITAEDSDRRHTVKVAEPSAPPALLALIDWLNALSS